MCRLHIHLVIILLLALFTAKLYAQEWEFAKEKDGIRVYTSHEPDSRIKSFKGEVDIHGEINAVCALIEDVEQFDEWDKDISEIRVLEHQQGKMIRYHVVYDVPWPFQDRDLCVEATISADPVNGVILVQSKPLTDAVPLNENHVRIVDYRQKWLLEPKENGMVHITIEGFADPAGDIPAWIVNMAITDTPLNMLRNIRETIESPYGPK